MKFRNNKTYSSPREAFENVQHGQKVKIILSNKIGTVRASRLEIKGPNRKENCIIDLNINGCAWSVKWNEIYIL